MIETSVQEPPVCRRWLRFSMRTAMLLVVAAAVAASAWLTARERARNRELEQQNLALRNELGYLTIAPGDEDKLHAIAVPTVEPHTWKWRVYMPPGKQFKIHAFSGKVSESGLPQPSSTISRVRSVKDGQQNFVVAIRKDQKGRWQWVVKFGSGGMIFGVRDPKFLEGSFASQSEGVGQSVTKLASGQPLVLLRFRVFGQAAATSLSSNSITPGEGILLWITESPPSAGVPPPAVTKVAPQKPQ